MSLRTLLLMVLLLLVFIGLTVSSASGRTAPAYYNIWYFGQGAGITFNSSGGPAALLDGMTATMEGCATICDPITGRLLFYTDGVTVWNSRHEIMKNGEGLLGHASSTQSALIVPSPGDSSVFYVFTTGALHQGLGDAVFGFHYSIVDLKIDGGLGAVMEKNIPLFRNSTEKIAATRHCNGRDYWVVTHEWGTNNFRSYLVDHNGVSHVPIISGSGILYPYSADTISTSGYGAGMIKISPNGRKLAAANWQGEVAELFDFDNRTGVVSNPLVLKAPRQIYYGASFSPDNSKLYVTGVSVPCSIMQFDLSSNHPDTIANSMQSIPVPGAVSGGGLQLGPDGRIYAAFPNRPSLGVITHPNYPAPTCDYVHDGLSLGGRTTLQGLSYCIDYDLFPTPRVAATGHNFGTISGCMDSLGRMTLMNDCSGIWRITGIETGLSQFSLAAPPLPMILYQGDTLQLPVRFAPGGSGKYSTTVRVMMTAIDGSSRNDTLEIPLSGVGQKRAASAAIARTHSIYPGHALRTPLELQAPLDDAGIRRIRITLSFDSTFIRLFDTGNRDDMLRGTLLEGWTVEECETSLGSIRITLGAPDTVPPLHGIGPLLSPILQAFLTTRTTSELKGYVEVLDRECAAIYTTSGSLTVDSLCGMRYRMMERLSSYTRVVLEQNRPNPFASTTTITFIAPAGGHALLQVLDSRGLPLASLIDGEIAPGKHEVIWNAFEYPNGLYLCRLQLGNEVRTVWMSVVR